MDTRLTGVVADHIDAVNAFDLDAATATFAPDAYVNARQREIRGTDAIRAWLAKEYIGDHVTVDVVKVRDHHGDTVVHGRYDGTYDKTNLPDELILCSYFSVRDGRIATLFVTFNPLSDKEELAS
jgi:hypothetical protein